MEIPEVKEKTIAMLLSIVGRRNDRITAEVRGTGRVVQLAFALEDGVACAIPGGIETPTPRTGVV